MKLGRKEAEDYIYSSYMKALPHLSYDMSDSKKRHPEYTEEIIKSLFRGNTAVAVTGSKGKGSAAYILMSILSLKMKTGLMTSPHILDFNERFRIDDDLIEDAEFADIVSGLKPLFDQAEPDHSKGLFISPIGIETAVALSFFARHDTVCDIFEHGKGVRYDDVRNVPAEYAIINTIFLEHTRELGSTIEEIASDKASVIRPGMKCVFSGEQSAEALQITENAAKEAGVPLKLYGRDFEALDIRFQKDGMICNIKTDRRLYRDLGISLLGENQCRNLALAMAAAEEIQGGSLASDETDEKLLRDRLMHLEWFGRLSMIRKDPPMLVDCCVNRNSADYALRALRELGIDRADIILAIPDDKDFAGVAVKAHEAGHHVILSAISNPHYRFTSKQPEELKRLGVPFIYAESISDALSGATRPTAVLGTAAMLGEIRRWMKNGI